MLRFILSIFFPGQASRFQTFGNGDFCCDFPFSDPADGGIFDNDGTAGGGG